MTMEHIYLDNSATTALSPAVKRAMCEAMECFGNPSSLHNCGTRAAELLRECRATVGEALGERHMKDGQLIFTSSGTEATTLALLGTARAKARRTASVVLSTDSEHPSVEENLRVLEQMGYRVIRVSTRGGKPDMDAVRAACTPDLFMVTMMLVNNETGAIYPVREVFDLARAANPDCICHCDAVQGFLKVPMTAKALGADLITVSAHKIHGPKGVGALWVSQRLLTARALTPFYGGGGQEYGFRSGTENMIGIAGFAAACREANAKKAEFSAKTGALSARLIAALGGSEIKCNLPEKRAPHIVSIMLPDIKSETMLHFLDSKGIAVSAGSACSSHAKAPSGTLLAFGLAPAEADCTLRVSFSRQNSEDDADALVAALQEGVQKLIRIHH